MARQPGARAQLALAYETVYGTPPVSGYRRMPFASTTLGAEQPLLSPELLGYGRDPLAPIRDAIAVDGNVVIPIDAEGIGFWLKALLGQPTSTGTTPRTHTFQSGGWTLPSMAIEKQLDQIPAFAMYSGAVADTLSFTMQRSGLLTANVGLIARGENIAGVTAAGTPTDLTLPLQRFSNFQGAISRNGSALAMIQEAQFNYSNNLDRIETIRSDGLIEGADPSMASLTGSLTARFADLVLVNQALAGDPCEIAVSWQISANASLIFTAHAVYLPRPRVQIEGPQGVEVQFDFQAARAASPARMCTAVLVNAINTY